MPERRVGSATARTPKLPSWCAPSQSSFPELRSSLHHPVSQTMKRAPSMDPEAMKPVRPRSFPRDRSDLTARVAHTMKPIFPPQFPSAKLSTPCTGRPRHEAAAVVSVARSAGTNLTARGSRSASCSPTRFPEQKNDPTARCTRTAEPPRHPVSRAVKQPQLHGSPIRWSQRRHLGCPKHRRSPHRTGCSSDRTSFASRLPVRRCVAPLR